MTHLPLTRAEVEAVISYIFWHVRPYPNSTGYKVWEKMLEFISDEDDGEPQEAEARLFE